MLLCIPSDKIGIYTKHLHAHTDTHKHRQTQTHTVTDQGLSVGQALSQKASCCSFLKLNWARVDLDPANSCHQRLWKDSTWHSPNCSLAPAKGHVKIYGVSKTYSWWFHLCRAGACKTLAFKTFYDYPTQWAGCSREPNCPENHPKHGSLIQHVDYLSFWKLVPPEWLGWPILVYPEDAVRWWLKMEHHRGSSHLSGARAGKTQAAAFLGVHSCSSAPVPWISLQQGICSKEQDFAGVGWSLRRCVSMWGRELRHHVPHILIISIESLVQPSLGDRN